MEWQLQCSDSDSGVDYREFGEHVLQVYIETLQNPENLENILSDYCILDYFGRYYHGKKTVSSQIIKYLHGSTYEVSTYKINNRPSKEWEISSHEHDSDQDLGVSLLSPPKIVYPSLTVTPNGSKSLDRRRPSLTVKRTAKDACLDGITRNLKMCKVDHDDLPKDTISEQKDLQMSSPSLRKIAPNDLKYILAQGTVRYPKKLVSTNDPKQIKHHSIISPRDRFCQLDLGFELENNEKQFKIWRIRYCISSKVTPKNLLKLFNEVQPD